MANIFDRIQKSAFKVVTNTFGYCASWQPSDGSKHETAQVLKKEPTKEYELAGIEYNPQMWLAEYHKPHFPGLYQASESGKHEEITINNELYYVRKVVPIWDGQSYRIIMQHIIQ